MTIKDRAAIVGIGRTPYWKRGQSYPETIAIGERVEIVFGHVNEEMAVPRFRPADIGA